MAIILAGVRICRFRNPADRARKDNLIKLECQAKNEGIPDVRPPHSIGLDAVGVQNLPCFFATSIKCRS